MDVIRWGQITPIFLAIYSVLVNCLLEGDTWPELDQNIPHELGSSTEYSVSTKSLVELI